MTLHTAHQPDLDISREPRCDETPATIDAWLDMHERFLRLPSAQKESIREELRSHLTDRVRDLMLAGYERDHAMRHAISELGEAAELASQFVHANRYPRRRLLMHGALFSLGAAAIVTVSAAVFSTGSNNGSALSEPAVFNAGELRAQQIDALKGISLRISEDMSPRQIIAAIADSKQIGVSINWGSLEEIGVTPDEPMGLSAEKMSVYDVLGQLAMRFGDQWDGIDWRLDGRMLTIDRSMIFDLRERVLASYDVVPILDVMINRFDRPYDESNEQIAGVIQELIEPTQWEANGGVVAQLRIVNGRMFVHAPLRTQQKVAWVLGELGKTGAMQDAEHAHHHAAPDPSVMPNPNMEEVAVHQLNQVAMARLRNIHMGCLIYEQEDRQEPLASLQQLVDGGFLPAGEVKSPHGPAKDGNDYWIDYAGFNLEGVDWAQRIVGIDRAMYEKGGNVATLFADGHIELLTIARFHAMLDNEANAGIKPDLPKRREANDEPRAVERRMLANADAQELGQLLIEALGGDVEIVVDQRTNSLVLTAPSIRLTRLEPLLERLDTPVSGH